MMIFIGVGSNHIDAIKNQPAAFFGFDIEIFNNLGVMPRPLFDTQIAAMAAGFGEQVAYDALVRSMLRVDIDKSWKRIR